MVAHAAAEDPLKDLIDLAQHGLVVMLIYHELLGPQCLAINNELSRQSFIDLLRDIEQHFMIVPFGVKLVQSLELYSDAILLRTKANEGSLEASPSGPCMMNSVVLGRLQSHEAVQGES